MLSLYTALRLAVTALVLMLPGAPTDEYAGARACATCHPAIGQQQSQSRHAQTWRTRGFPAEYDVELEGQEKLSLPIRAVVGGDRFGFSFIVELDKLRGRPLPRKTLVEGRYMQSAKTGQRTLSPGLPAEEPASYTTAIGRVLSPLFAQKCLKCHGIPSETFKDGGVRCEHCHGPGRKHIRAVGEKGKDLQIVHPGKLPAEDLLEVCSQCHSGFFPLQDPRPDDVLISNQVVALKNSNCYVKSGKQLTCLKCHNPHTDARHEDRAYERACLSCHSAGKEGSKLCAARRMTECVSCHMPVVRRSDSFPLRDHWIRVVERSLPESIRASVMRGAAMAERGEKNQAIRFLESLILRGEAEPSLFYNLALAYEEAGRAEDARKSYEKAIQLEPDLVAAHINLGSLFLSQKRVDEAIVSFEKAAEINPLEVSAHYNLAIAHQMKGDADAARRALRLVVAIDPRMK